MKYLTMELPDGSVWGVPVSMVAKSRADHYKGEFDNDLQCSLKAVAHPAEECD